MHSEIHPLAVFVTDLAAHSISKRPTAGPCSIFHIGS